MGASRLLDAEHIHASRRPTGLPRLLMEVPAYGSMGLDEHLALHGSLPAPRRTRERSPALIEQLGLAGLRGRGGAGFPTARKLEAVLRNSGRGHGRPILVVNAADSEPASEKDRLLTRALPHLVLDGAELTARALGAEEMLVAIGESALASIESISLAISEREGVSNRRPLMQATTIPDRYVAGQETALVASLNGSHALPTFSRARLAQRGVKRRPTLLSNAETFAHIALIARHGPDWFRELGTDSQPGSALVTLSGPVAAPGVYEIEHGTPLVDLLHAAGGLRRSVGAAVLGGYGGCWVGAQRIERLTLCNEQLDGSEVSLGAGVVALLSDRACPVAETTRIVRWLAGQSARQCGPCTHGLDTLALTLGELTAPAARNMGLERIEQLIELVRGRGACSHPDGAARLVRSALDEFEPEFRWHAAHGQCESCQSEMELPT